MGRSLGNSGQQRCQKAFGDCQGLGVEGPEKALLSESGGGWGEFYFLKKRQLGSHKIDVLRINMVSEYNDIYTL